MAKPKVVNTKKEAGRAIKSANEEKKKQQASAQQEAAQAADWQNGANVKKSSRDEAAALKADEAARKRREKAELLAAEEEAIGGGGKAKKAPPAAAAKKKKDNLSLLEDALTSAADKAAKKKKAAEIAKQQEQQQREREAIAKRQQEQDKMDPLLANTQKMIGTLLDDDNDMKNDGGDNNMDIGRQANVARMEVIEASGVDAALSSLNLASSSSTPGAQVKVSAKALYNDFETKMLPIVKQEYPGLRLSQYKEKVWQLWKKSPENPANQIVPSAQQQS